MPRAACGALPPNIKVIEFFFLAGKWLHVPYAQQHYISANYTHAASYLLARGLNVVTQLVAKRVVDGETRYSLSCNTDTTLDILRARAEGPRLVQADRAGQFRTAVHAGRRRFAGPTNSARCSTAPRPIFPLFAPPSEPISDTKYAIGFTPRPGARRRHLQIGIGQVGDALAQG
jgi:hypothetical protein